MSEEVIEVMNGCICCTVRGDLVEALKRLHKKVEQFDAVTLSSGSASLSTNMLLYDGLCSACV